MSQDSIEEIKAILEHQNERMEHLIWQVVGNDRLGIEGLKPGVTRIEKELNAKLTEFTTEVQKLKAWREGMWKIDLKAIVTKETVSTMTRVFIYALLAGIVGGGGMFGFNELLKLILEK